MNIPLNGRIALVDDKYNEIKPLISLLSKKRIPFNYYTGLKAAELPENSDKNPITFLFLDLNIVESQHNPKVVISTLHPILKALCPSGNKPYFIIIWSKKINDFADHLEKHFKKDDDLKDRKPVMFIRLDKTDYFGMEEDGSYAFDEDKYDLLFDNIKNEFENISLLKNFLLWENIVHNETKETVGEFSSFFDFDDKWNANTKAIIFHLSKAILGNDDIEKSNDETKLIAAFSKINSFLSDKIQHTLINDKLGPISGISDDNCTKKNKDGRLTSQIKGKINSKLHTSNKGLHLNYFEQGNIYKLPYDIDAIKKVLDKDSYNNITRTNILRSKPSLLQLDLTPVCDYSQDKKYVRLILGVLIKQKFSTINIRNSYQCQTPIFHIDNEEYFMVFDYRFISTMTKNEIKKRKISPILRLRKEICTDIQSQLANQINRPGISNV